MSQLLSAETGSDVALALQKPGGRQLRALARFMPLAGARREAGDARSTRKYGARM